MTRAEERHAAPVQSLRDFQGSVFAFQCFMGWQPDPPTRSWWSVITSWCKSSTWARAALMGEER